MEGRNKEEEEQITLIKSGGPCPASQENTSHIIQKILIAKVSQSGRPGNPRGKGSAFAVAGPPQSGAGKRMSSADKRLLSMSRAIP